MKRKHHRIPPCEPETIAVRVPTASDRTQRRTLRSGAQAALRRRFSWVARQPALRFVLAFGLLVCGFYAGTASGWFKASFFPAYLDWTASVSATVLRCLGEDALAREATVRSPRMALEINRGCEALEPAAMFLAGVLALPRARGAKLLAVLVGVPLLLLLNFVRIVSLYYIGVLVPAAFETAHIEVWQPLFILATLLLWLVWALWISRGTPRSTRHAAA